jgi:DNA polymerase-4
MGPGSVTPFTHNGAVSPATILHADLDAFYASVEVRNQPRLRGLPVAVGGGVVLSCTYEARAFGVAGGMPIGEARRRCPRLVVVHGSFSDYVGESRRVFEIFERFTPQVEPLSIDEGFLDVGGARRLFGSPRRIGSALRAAVRAETGLAVSVGAANTKFLAKVASRLAKPDGMIVVEPGDEIEFLHALPVEALWGVGPATASRLARYGITTVHDIASLPAASLKRWLGPGLGSHIGALAQNRDPRPVEPRRGAGSVGSQRTFARSSHDADLRDAVLLDLADRVGRRLRAKGRSGRRITVRIRYADFEEATRSTTLTAPTAATDAIYRVARRLSLPAAEDPRGLRLLGVSVSLLDAGAPLQLELPLGDVDPVQRAGTAAYATRRAVDATVDGLRQRFGRDAIRRAALLDAGTGPTLRELAENAPASAQGAGAHPSAPGERLDQRPGGGSLGP